LFNSILFLIFTVELKKRITMVNQFNANKVKELKKQAQRRFNDVLYLTLGEDEEDCQENMFEAAYDLFLTLFSIQDELHGSPHDYPMSEDGQGGPTASDNMHDALDEIGRALKALLDNERKRKWL
jgi:hypothetical protein